MKYKLFGKQTGLFASELILGAAMFGNRRGYGATAADAGQLLATYADEGGNMIDISDQYQLGEAEEIVGKFIGSKRSDFIICSKYTRSNEANPAISNSGNHRKAMRQAVESSLKRLRTDYLDVYMPHYDDGITPLEEIVAGLDDLVRAGKILYAGLANFPAWKTAGIIGIANAMQFVPLATIQFEYSLLQRTPDRELVPMAEHFGLAAMLYSPLAGGLLTGKYRRGETGRINLGSSADQPENLVTKAIIDRLIIIAGEIGATPGQVAIAWELSKNGFPIIGTRTLLHLEDALKATTVELTKQHLCDLDELSKVSLGYPHDLLANVQRTKEL